MSYLTREPTNELLVESRTFVLSSFSFLTTAAFDITPLRCETPVAVRNDSFTSSSRIIVPRHADSGHSGNTINVLDFLLIDATLSGAVVVSLSIITQSSKHASILLIQFFQPQPTPARHQSIALVQLQALHRPRIDQLRPDNDGLLDHQCSLLWNVELASCNLSRTWRPVAQGVCSCACTWNRGRHVPTWECEPRVPCSQNPSIIPEQSYSFITASS